MTAQHMHTLRMVLQGIVLLLLVLVMATITAPHALAGGDTTDQVITTKVQDKCLKPGDQVYVLVVTIRNPRSSPVAILFPAPDGRHTNISGLPGTLSGHGKVTAYVSPTVDTASMELLVVLQWGNETPKVYTATAHRPERCTVKARPQPATAASQATENTEAPATVTTTVTETVAAPATEAPQTEAGVTGNRRSQGGASISVSWGWILGFLLLLAATYILAKLIAKLLGAGLAVAAALLIFIIIAGMLGAPGFVWGFLILVAIAMTLIVYGVHGGRRYRTLHT